jgi:hypothetical protein
VLEPWLGVVEVREGHGGRVNKKLALL